MWPLISPASGAPVSFIFDLIRLWPVFHMQGLPPSSAIRSNSAWLALTSAMIVAPGCASSTGSARMASSWSPQIDPALAVDRADPVAVAVEGDAEIEALLARPAPSGRRDSSRRSGRDGGWESGCRRRCRADDARPAASPPASRAPARRRRCRRPSRSGRRRRRSPAMQPVDVAVEHRLVGDRRRCPPPSRRPRPSARAPGCPAPKKALWRAAPS